MYNNILVVVDGSKLAESVLPHVEAMANGCEVRNITFLRVVEPYIFHYGGAEAYAFSQADIDAFEAERQKEATDYLAALKSRLKYKANVKTDTTSGFPADAIISYAARNAVDLIIISTHGRSGVSRWVWGSVADRILHSSPVPVFMVRAPGCVSGI